MWQSLDKFSKLFYDAAANRWPDSGEDADDHKPQD